MIFQGLDGSCRKQKNNYQNKTLKCLILQVDNVVVSSGVPDFETRKPAPHAPTVPVLTPESDEMYETIRQ